jgi:hypothetical protein
MDALTAVLGDRICVRRQAQVTPFAHALEDPLERLLRLGR